MKCQECTYKIEHNNCVLSRCIYDEDHIEEERKKHKCYGCAWGRWTGVKYVCGLPRCMPNLGTFNGVDKNG